MVEVTEADRKLYLRLLGIGRENAQARRLGLEITDPLDLIATHRDAAAKAVVERYAQEMLKMGKAYSLGSSESRAIITAVEHANIVCATPADALEKQHD